MNVVGGSSHSRKKHSGDRTGWLLCWGVRCQALQTFFGRSEFADVARRGHASLRDRRCWPSQDGIRRMRRTNLGQRASRQTWRQHKPANGLASSIVPAGHRSADRRNPRFLLVRFYGSEVVVRSSMLRIIRVCLRHGLRFLLGRAEPSMPPVATKRCAARRRA
jgi:hypothetical protein